MTVTYDFTKNGTKELTGSVAEFGGQVVDKKIWDIIDVTNCVNGTFFWIDNKGNTYSTSILMFDGILYQNVANHYWRGEYPQDVFVVYKNGAVSMQRVQFAHEIIDFDNVRHLIGGVGLINKLDPTFKYDPSACGFFAKFADVLRKANKTVVAYKQSTGEICLMVRPSIWHKRPWTRPWEYDLLQLVKDLGYDIALSVDGGGSTFMDAFWKYVFQGEASRRIHNILGFNLGGKR